jgi:hypothetical protein
MIKLYQIMFTNERKKIFPITIVKNIYTTTHRL